MSAAVPSGWLVEAMIASTLLMAAILLLRAPARRLLGPQVAYALWALPLLRMLLPPLPESWREAAATPISRATDTITVILVDPVATVAPAVESHPWSIWLMICGLWAMGAAAFFVWHLMQHSRFCRRMLGDADALDARDGVRIIASTACPGPLAFGIVRRYVAFPRDFAERYDADERKLALEHELGHHARGDLIANWAALLVLALHWFNPVAWRAFRAFRADQELANDARVLAGRSATERHIYACAIVKAAHGGALSAACHLHTITDLKGRLKMLKTSPASRRRVAIGAASVAALVTGGLALTASGSGAAAAITTTVDTIAQVAPNPPAPPAPEAIPSAPAFPTAPAPGHVWTDAKGMKHVIVPKRHAAEDTDEGAGTRYTSDGSRRIVLIGKEGKDFGPGDESLAMVNAGNCTGGDARQMVLQRDSGRQHMMVICQNRIAKISADAAAAGANAAARSAEVAANGAEIERHAMLSARASLRIARASIDGNRNMTTEQRREALAGIDEAQAELDADAAKD